MATGAITHNTRGRGRFRQPEAVLDALPLANEARPGDRLFLGAGSAEDHVAAIELLAERREARNGLGPQTAIWPEQTT